RADPDVVNAAKKHATLIPGAAIVHHADSFALIRGGRLDYSILGGLQVAPNGDIANWKVPGQKGGGGVGGAMDLAVGARNVLVMMRHQDKAGASKLVTSGTFPLTAVNTVTRVYTELGVFECAGDAFIMRDCAPGIGRDELAQRTDAALRFPSRSTARPHKNQGDTIMIRTLCLALCLFSAAVCAAPFPSKPINLIVPYPPGGAVDPIARLYAEKISQNWGVPVFVLNRPGAGTTIGLNQAAKAEPDGYTVVLATASITSNAPLYRSLPYDTLKDFTYLSMAGMIPLAITANPRTPVNSLDELVDRLKRQPGSLTYSSSGNGTIIHLGGELFKSLAGVDMVHVPYKGSGPSVMAGVAGEVDL